MGKFLSRFALGAALGLFAIWLWGQLNQDDDDDFEDDDEVIEIPIGNQQARATPAHASNADDAGRATHARVDPVSAAPKAGASENAAAKADSAVNNLEWVDGIGQAFNRTLNEAGIKTDHDLAKASVEQLRATGINRNDEEFASWIEQARQRVGGK